MPPAPPIPTIPAERRWRALIVVARGAVQTARDEMDDYFNDRTETRQHGEKGEEIIERIQALEQLADLLRELAT